MKKFFSALLSISLLLGLALPSMTVVTAATPTTVAVNPLNYDQSKITWYSDSACTTAATVNLTTSRTDWARRDINAVVKYTQGSYSNGTVSDHGVLSIDAYASETPVLEIAVPEITADGWYNVSYYAGAFVTYAQNSPFEITLTKKSDANYSEVIAYHYPGINSGTSTTSVGKVSHNDGVWLFDGGKVYLEAASDYVMHITLGKGWSLASNQYNLMLSDIILSPTIATPISTTKATVLEYEDYATYYTAEKTNASDGKLIRDKTAVMSSKTTPYVITMPVTITKEGYYDWKSVMSTQAGSTHVSKMTLAVDGETTLVNNVDAGIDTNIETWTDECTFDMDTYSGTVYLTAKEHIITTTIECRHTDDASGNSMIGFAADYFSLECQDKDVDISVPVEVAGETTIEMENYASLVTYFNSDWGSNAAYDSASKGRLLAVKGGTLPSPATTATYEAKINVTKPGYYDTEFWVSSNGSFYSHSLLNFTVDGDNVGDANEKAGVPTAKYTYNGFPVHAFKGTTVYLSKGEHTVGIVAEKAVNSGNIVFNADCIKLIPSTPVSVGDTKTTIELEKYNTTAVVSNSNAPNGKLLFDTWYFANSDDYKISIPISVSEEGYYDFESVISMNGVSISPMNITLDGEKLITNMDDGTHYADLDSTYHLAKYTKTKKVSAGTHLLTLTVKSPQTITASGSGASFKLQLLKYAADYISIVKSDKDILDQEDNSLYLNKNLDSAETGTAYAALYRDGLLVDVQKQTLTNSNKAEFDFTNTSWTDYDRASVFVWDDKMNTLSDATNHEIMPANDDPFAGDDEINVVYLGDSLYEGYGITDGRRFVEQTGAWFEKTYENENTAVNWYNEGYGSTTTGYSVVRLARDVVSHNPDVVFIAQTINDGNADSRRNLETIVKTLQSLENPPYIIFTVFPNSTWNVNATFGKEVAAHYGIPVIDGTPAFEKAISEGYTMTTGSLFKDGVHPNDTGHDYISEYMISLLETNRYWSKGTIPSTNLIPSSAAIDIDSLNYVSVLDDSITKSSGWTAGEDCVDATAAGETLSFTFNGNFLGFEYGQLATSGNIEIWVDGTLVKTCSTTYSGLSNWFFVCTDKSVYLDLEDGNHEVVLKTAENTNGVNNRVYGIFTGSWAD